MSELRLILSAEEGQFLVNLLEETLKGSLVEEHRTRTPAYRQDILQREDVIRALLTQLRQPTG
jgi:hypothetical protein